MLGNIIMRTVKYIAQNDSVCVILVSFVIDQVDGQEMLHCKLSYIGYLHVK